MTAPIHNGGHAGVSGAVHRRIESVLEEVEAAAPWFDKDVKALLEQVAELRAR